MGAGWLHDNPGVINGSSGKGLINAEAGHIWILVLTIGIFNGHGKHVCSPTGIKETTHTHTHRISVLPGSLKCTMRKNLFEITI